jgi:predicted Zn-dependent protease
VIRSDGAVKMENDLLAVAEHWCREGERLGAEFAQAFVEVTVDLRLECTVRGPNIADAGPFVERRSGVGLLLRHRDAWWYGSAPLAEPNILADRLSQVPGLGIPRSARPLHHHLDTGRFAESPWQRLARAYDATCTDWTGGSENAKLSLVQDFFRQHRAVVDSRGVSRSWLVSGGRQRCTATVFGADSDARSFSRASSLDWGSETPVADIAASAEGLARDAIGRAIRLLPARSIGRRTTPVVFAPKVGAALLHELIGHALEADNFAQGSAYTAGLMGGVVCDAPLHLVDDPTIVDGFGSRAVDDDGQPCLATPMVTDGVVVGQLTSLRSAYEDSARCTGNGRRQRYDQASLPRASNTVVLPGPDDAEALGEIPPGGMLYIAALSSGEIALARGEFCFSAAESYFLTPHADPLPLKDVNIFGAARAALQQLTGIADDVQGDNVTCGKQQQSVHIGLYSPTMRFDALTWWC